MSRAERTTELHRIAIATEKLSGQFIRLPQGGPFVIRNRRGDRLLEELYRGHRRELVRYVVRTFGAGPPDPEDVVQAVFERFAQQLSERDLANPVAFLVTMARNHVLDQRRRQLVRDSYCSDLCNRALHAHTLDADRIVGSRQQLSLVQAAIAALDERSRKILLMSRIEGLSSAEIARRQGCSATLVKNIIARSLSTCRDMLENGELPGDYRSSG